MKEVNSCSRMSSGMSKRDDVPISVCCTYFAPGCFQVSQGAAMYLNVFADIMLVGMFSSVPKLRSKDVDGCHRTCRAC